MKIYALRIEQAESVLGHLMKRSMTGASLSHAFDTFLAQLLSALQSAAAEPVHIETHAFADLERAKAKLLRSDITYLSFDSQSNRGVTVGVSRRFDLVTGVQLGLTSRPGFDELGDQLEQLKYEHGTQFGIIEDDIYTGGTLRYMIDMFEKAGITISSVVSGISATRAIGDVPVQAAIFYQADELLELTDPRDYIFGAHNGGLVVSYLGQKLRVPYDMAFVDMVARSSLDRQKLADFTHALRRANYDLHEYLGSLDYPAALFYPSGVLRRAGFPAGATLREILQDGLNASP